MSVTVTTNVVDGVAVSTNVVEGAAISTDLVDGVSITADVTVGGTGPAGADGMGMTPQAVGFTVAGGTTPKTLTVALDANVSGTNTGDQTIPHFLYYDSMISATGVLQGIASDGTHIYTTTATMLYKYLIADGTLAASQDISAYDPASTTHKGDLCYYDGHLYIGSGYPAPGSVLKVLASDLSNVAVIPTQDDHDASAVARDSAGNFWVTTYTGISAVTPPRIYKYSSTWVYQAVYDLEIVDTGGTWGYDGAEWIDGCLFVNIHEGITNNEYIDKYKFDGSTFTRVQRIPHLLNSVNCGQGIALDPLDSSLLWVAARTGSDAYRATITNEVAPNALAITNPGSSSGLSITQVGNTGNVNTRGALFIENTENDNIGLMAYSNHASPVNGLSRFEMDNVGSTREVILVSNEGTGNGILIDQNGNGVALKIQSEATTAETFRIEGKNTTGTLIESYTTGEYTGTGYNTAHNFTIQNTAATGQNAQFWHQGPGPNVLINSDSNGIGLFIDKDVTNLNHTAVNTKIDHTSVVNDAGTYTKTGAALQINSNVTETSGTITDSAQVLDINQTHADASGNIIDISNAGTGKGLFIDQNGVGNAIEIDQDANSASAITGLKVNVANAGAGASYAALFETGSVGIGVVAPNDNAILDVTSTTKAFMPPRMTTTQRDAISTPTEGMIIFNITTHVLDFYNGTAWGAV